MGSSFKSDDINTDRINNSIDSIDDESGFEDVETEVKLSDDNYQEETNYDIKEKNMADSSEITDVIEDDDGGFEPIESKSSNGKAKSKKEKKSDSSEKKKGKGFVGILVGGLVVVGILGFVGNMVLDVYNETVEKQKTVAGLSPKSRTEVSSKKEKEEDTKKVLSRKEENPLYSEKSPVSKNDDAVLKPDVKEQSVMTPIEKEVIGVGDFSLSDNGGVCVLSMKYKAGKEYVYFVKDANNNFIPAFDTENWNHKGIVVDDKIIVHGNREDGFVFVEDGKYLPIELFSSCSSF